MLTKNLLCATLFLLIGDRSIASDFITKWDLSKPGSSNTQISFGAETSDVVNYTWEEIGGSGKTGTGSFKGETCSISNLPAGSIIRLHIMPTNFQGISFYNVLNDRKRLLDVEQWGSVVWTSMIFWDCNNLTITASDIPDLSKLTSMENMFWGCSKLNGPSTINSWNTATVTNMSGMFKNDSAFNQVIGNWNTASVTDMSRMFEDALSFNQAIGNWNTASVTTMYGMFYNAKSFNQAIGNWNTGSVKDMWDMFHGASSFNQPIGNWNTANVETMEWMFAGAKSFNQAIGNWNTAKVRLMTGMFSAAKSFNQPIGNWNTDNVISMGIMFSGAESFNQAIGNWNTAKLTSMGSMFANAKSFNQPIDNWNTAKVIYMNSMFQGAKSFNQPINSWNTARVQYMSSMFLGATSFNQPIGNWITDSVISMYAMFGGASAFNQPISYWITNKVRDMRYMFTGAKMFNQVISALDLSSCTNMEYMLDSSGIDCNQYSGALSFWSSRNYTPPNITLGAQNMHYSPDVEDVRNRLKVLYHWTFIGDQKGCSTTNIEGIPTNPIEPRLYPNPAKEYLMIELPTMEEATVRVLTMSGQEVIKQTVSNTNNTLIDLRDLAPGIYIVEVCTPKGLLHHSFIKE